MNLLRKIKTTRIIRKINRLDISLEELLMLELNNNNNNKIKYILNNYVINLDYVNNLGYDFLSLAVSKGNIEFIESLIENNININKKYKCGKKLVPVTYYVKDIETLKYLEKYIDKKEIRKSIESIIKTTLTSYDIKLLDYIIKNYSVNLNKIKYNIQNKKYNILELTEEILQGMKNREYRKREMAFYISELLLNKRYKKIEKRAYEILSKTEEEIIEIEEYYKYIKKQFGVKNENISTKKFKI